MTERSWERRPSVPVARQACAVAVARPARQAEAQLSLLPAHLATTPPRVHVSGHNISRPLRKQLVLELE